MRYDLYGRGYSERPTNVGYDPDLFDRQLLELVGALKVRTPLTPVGWSLGGAISVIFLERHPDLVNALVLVDPGGFADLVPDEIKPNVRLVRLPGVGEYLMRVSAGGRSMQRGENDDFYDQAVADRYYKRSSVARQYKGFQYAVLSTLRHMPDDMTTSFEAVGASRKPVLLVWGREDRLLPVATSEKVRAASPHAEFVAVEQAGHVAHYEKPEVVNAAILAFLRRVAPVG